MKVFIAAGKNLTNPPTVEKEYCNHFYALNTPESTSLEEGELPQLECLVEVHELYSGTLEQFGISNSRLSNSEFPREGDPLQHSLIRVNASPSYANITRKKQDESSGS